MHLCFAIETGASYIALPSWLRTSFSAAQLNTKLTSAASALLRSPSPLLQPRCQNEMPVHSCLTAALQGLVLVAQPLAWEALDQLPAPESLPSRPPPVWLALDEVQDPVRPVDLPTHVCLVMQRSYVWQWVRNGCARLQLASWIPLHLMAIRLKEGLSIACGIAHQANEVAAAASTGD